MDYVKNRYMFDTCALNRICRNADDEMQIYLTKHRGWEFYFSEIQCTESGANILKPSKNLDPQLIERCRAELAFALLRLIPKLQTKYIGLIATLRPNKWLLDGTYELLQDCEQDAFDLFSDILNDNDTQHYNDAMIGMTAIVHGCILVTEDRRLYNKVNSKFPGRCIRYDDFMGNVAKCLSSTTQP